MSITIEIPDPVSWRTLRLKIEAEIDRRTVGLRTCPVDSLVREQAFIGALEWVLDEASPPPPESEEAEDEIYD